MQTSDRKAQTSCGGVTVSVLASQLEGAGWDWVRIPVGSTQWQCQWHIWPCSFSDCAYAGGLSEQTQPIARVARSNRVWGFGKLCVCVIKLSHKPNLVGL